MDSRESDYATIQVEGIENDRSCPLVNGKIATQTSRARPSGPFMENMRIGGKEKAEMNMQPRTKSPV